jgi:endonuclease/exonuclease/phosphatase family metal-dependent hydrolase
VRGLRVVRPETRWAIERRRRDAALLSDHSPVEVEVE